MTLRHIVFTLTLALGLVTSTAAMAVVDDPADINLTDSSRITNLDEVLIVAQPKEVFNLRQQPISSTVFSGEQLNQYNIRDLRDISLYVPSFTMPNYGSRLTSSMYIRGIGSRVNSPAVGVYVDDVPLLSKAAFNQHIYQTSRADVLRGPQGTLYGQNTEGGLLRVYSLNPMQYQGTDVILGGGTYGYRNVEAAHYARPSDGFAYSLAAFYTGQDGFFTNQIGGLHADKIDEAGGKARFIFRLTDRWTAQLSADYQYTKQNGFPYGVLDPATGKTADPATNRQGNYRRNMLTSALQLSYRGSLADFNSVTSYQYLKDYMMMDLDYLPIDFMHLEQRQLQNAFTQEFTLRSNRQGIWQWATGAFFSASWLKTWAPVYFDEALTSPIGNAIQSAMYNAMVASMAARFLGMGMSEEAARAQAAATIERAGGVTMDVVMDAPGIFRTPQYNLAFFHESNFQISQRLVATLGLRYDYNHVGVDYATSAFMAMTANVMGTEATYVLSSNLRNHASDDFNQLLPKVGLKYTIDNNGSNVYATVSKGYRAGGFNIQMFSDILQTELNANQDLAMRGSYDVPHDDESYANLTKTIAFKPEVSWNYEVGTHLNLWNRRINLDLSAFYMQVRDQQLSVMAGNYGFGRRMVNAGKSNSCGVEMSLRGNAFNDRFTWSASYGFTRAVFSDYSDQEEHDGKVVTIDYKDNYIPFVPQHTFAATANYLVPLAAKTSLQFGVQLNGAGKTYWDEANTISQKLYASLGAHADLNWKRITFSLWGRNLTNTHFNSFAVQSAATGETLTFAQQGNPLQVGGDIKFHF